MTNEIKVADHAEVHTAGVRETVPMEALTEFFGRAFGRTMQTLARQGVQPVGPPYGKYYGMPGATVDVEAGFPVAQPITGDGDVTPGTLPGGRVVEAVHVGPYDTMERTYAEVQRFFGSNGLTPGPVMWESYLTDPDAEPDPAGWRTLICWPIAD